MDLAQIFTEMNDFELKMAFEEFVDHEKTRTLKNGIIRKLAEQMKGDLVSILGVEHALLREIATRWYHKL